MTRRTDRPAKPTSSNPTDLTPASLPPTEPTPTEQPAEQPATAAPETPESGRAPFETFTADLPTWKAAALRAHTRWPAGREVTHEEFNKALEEATGQVIK